MPTKSEAHIWNEKLECMPRRELRELQLRSLNGLMERLLQVPFYRQSLANHVKGLPALKTLEDLSSLPFTTKSDLRDHYPLGFTAVDKSLLRRLHASSGTRGKPTIVGYTEHDISIWSEVCARSLAACGVRPGDVVQNSYGYGLFTGGMGLHQGAETLGATVIPSSGGRTQQQLMLLKDLQARVLCCTPSYAMNLALSLDHATKHDLKLEIGVFGAEPWSEECRAQLEDRLGIKAYDIYGLSEIIGPGVAVECGEQAGLHIWEDHFYPEIIDPVTLNTVAPGEFGELVLTSFTREAMPLLRYRTGDICSLIEEPCGCGRTSRRITRLRGRHDDMLIIRGVNIYPSEVESVLFSFNELVPHYQMVISRDRALDSLTVCIEVEETVCASWSSSGGDARILAERNLVERIGNILQDKFGLTAMVRVEQPGTIPRSEGKAIRVLDMRDTASGIK